ncbi:MAG: LPS export ABC transporter ATP-binding protein [Deltaproteobacteria bacterium]|nr:LPS export ABC transporter ATP-binding protein [Deltaproteobacteria bacterium]NIS78570.1 LPS export ABC transporter ATP-binding protein [Deltaproteobacteria bacterium]
MSTLQAKDIVKNFGKRKVLRGVSLQAKRGEVLGLLGPNGAGKTTLFYAITGLIIPDEGSIVLNDLDITTFPMYRRARLGIGYLPQEPSIFRKMNVEDNVLAILETLPISQREMKERLETLLSELGIEHLRKAKSYSLSGGERRRVEICRALTLLPSILLLDEPFAGIDPITIADLQRIIVKLRDEGIGVIITDHNVRDTLRVCDRAYIINEGEILEEGEPAYIFSSDIVKEVYLGEEFTL